VRRQPLAGCNARLLWANEHLYTLNSEIQSWLEVAGPFSVSSEFHPEANVVVVYAAVATPPLRWGVMSGNVVHNLRSALDHLVWQLVTLNGEKPRSGMGGNRFPIFDKDPVDFAKATKASLRGVHPDHRARIEGFQPYKRPNGLAPEDNPFAALDFLWNQDKHRALDIPTLGLEHTAEGALWGGPDVARIISMGFIPGPIKTDAVVAWAEIEASGPNPQMAMARELPLNVALSNGSPLVPNLQRLLLSTATVIGAFAEDFSERGRMATASPPLPGQKAGPNVGTH
jgi:hypothetical protein